jgi:antitoxin MazE
MKICDRSFTHRIKTTAPAQAGLEDQTTAHIAVENGHIILSKPTKAVRTDWSQAAAGLAAQGEDAPLRGGVAR